MDWIVETKFADQNVIDALGDRLVEYDKGKTKFSTPAIFYGSIPSLRWVYHHYKNVITWAYDEVYDCSYYLPYFGKYALNNPHLFVEYGSFNQLKKLVLEDADFFIKQNCGYKYFTGRVYDQYTDEDLKLLYHNDLLLLSESQQIFGEWRCVIKSTPCGHDLLTLSPYGDDEGNSKGLVNFVHEVLEYVEDYSPAPMWTLDICRHGDDFKAVEVNSLLSAGWYDCNIELIIDTVESIVNEDYYAKESR